MSPIVKTPPLTQQMLGHRMSILRLTQYCGQAGPLSQGAAGRSAAQSSAFHALCADAPNARELYMRLTDDEMAEITTWKRPTDIDLGDGIVLRYKDATKESEVALDTFGSYVASDSPSAVTIGHPDFYWIVTIAGRRIAYVADIKRSEWTVTEGTDSLQLHAYALAVASQHDCDAYAVGLWAAVEGRWQWSGILDLMSNEALLWSRRVVAAAQNLSSEYAMGPHCRSCYGRMRCPAWLIPPSAAKAELAPFAEGQSALTHDNVLKALLIIQRWADTAERMMQNIKEFAVRSNGITGPDGKVWRAAACQGRESVSVESVRTLLADVSGPDVPVERVAGLIKRGKPYEQFRWCNK